MKPEKELRKACCKIAKRQRDYCEIQLLPDGVGFLLMGKSEGFRPTIGVQGSDVIGSQDDFDFFLDLIGYEAQAEKVLFDPGKVKFILALGWCGKYWRKDQKTEGFTVDAIVVATPSKVATLALCLIAAVARESSILVRLQRGWRSLKQMVRKWGKPTPYAIPQSAMKGMIHTPVKK